MFDKFCDYMYYLLTSPFKRVKKSINQWYILFRVLGRRFDDALESLYNAEEQTMLATCEPEMLPVHAEDRKMARYPGEEDENFRARIANYPEVLRLGGSDPGVLLAVRTLGYATPELVKANEFKGRVYYQTDGTWNLDGGYLLDSDRSRYPVKIGFRYKGFMVFPYNVSKLNERFEIHIREPDGQIGQRAVFHIPLFYWDYRKTDGSWLTDGSCLLDSDRTVYKVRDGYRTSISHKEEIRQARMHRQHNLFYLDGSWLTDGSRVLDAWEQEIIIGYDLHYLDGTWLQDGDIILDGIENQEVM